MPAAQPLQPGQYYHIYNRGNNRENLFHEERNYAYFLRLYAFHIEPIAETFAYCLLKNHFHLLIRIKDLEEIPFRDFSQPFSNLFNAYTKSINKAYQHSGSLFQRPFGRILVTSDAYFKQLVTYIHQNPQKHRFVPDFRDWPYSSYHAHLLDTPTLLQRAQVLDWFNGPTQFTASHTQPINTSNLSALAPDDFD